MDRDVPIPRQPDIVIQNVHPHNPRPQAPAVVHRAAIQLQADIRHRIVRPPNQNVPLHNPVPGPNVVHNPQPPANVHNPLPPTNVVPPVVIAPQNPPLPQIPVVRPVLPQPNRNEDRDVADQIYQEVSRIIPDVNRRWVLERSGYDSYLLIDYILEHLDDVPIEPKRTSIDNLDNSQYTPGETYVEPEAEKNEETDLVVEVLEKLIRQLTEEKAVSSRKISTFLKQKYTGVKCAVLSSLPQMDARKLFAVCRLMNIRRLSRELAAELRLDQLFDHNDTPWLNPSRARKNQVCAPLGAPWQAAYDLVEETVERGKNNVVRFTCCVCYEDFSAKKIVSCGELEQEENDENAAECHHVCHECMRGQANALCSDGKLAEGGSGLCCLDPSCDRVIPWARVKVLLTKEVRNRLGKRLDNEALVNIDGLESCKRCSFAMLIETPVDIDKVFSCEKCRAEFCRICKRDWRPHIGKPCNEMKTVEDERESKRRKLEDELAMAIMRVCHRCKVQFAKGEGCNKMTCRCGATQCYVCRAQDINYNHFCQHVRDPGQPGCPANCSSCLLWENTDEVNKKALASIREKALTDRNMQEFADKL